jgi:hypothetical protein
MRIGMARYRNNGNAYKEDRCKTMRPFLTS